MQDKKQEQQGLEPNHTSVALIQWGYDKETPAIGTFILKNSEVDMYNDAISTDPHRLGLFYSYNQPYMDIPIFPTVWKADAPNKTDGNEINFDIPDCTICMDSSKIYFSNTSVVTNVRLLKYSTKLDTSGGEYEQSEIQSIYERDYEMNPIKSSVPLSQCFPDVPTPFTATGSQTLVVGFRHWPAICPFVVLRIFISINQNSTGECPSNSETSTSMPSCLDLEEWDHCSA